MERKRPHTHTQMQRHTYTVTEKWQLVCHVDDRTSRVAVKSLKLSAMCITFVQVDGGLLQSVWSGRAQQPSCHQF